jgi:hypothetical protein
LSERSLELKSLDERMVDYINELKKKAFLMYFFLGPQTLIWPLNFKVKEPSWPLMCFGKGMSLTNLAALRFILSILD